MEVEGSPLFRHRRWIVLGWLTLLGLLALFPPYRVDLPNGVSVSLGLGFVLSPPADDAGIGHIDWLVLCMELIGATLIAVVVWLAAWETQYPNTRL